MEPKTFAQKLKSTKMLTAIGTGATILLTGVAVVFITLLHPPAGEAAKELGYNAMWFVYLAITGSSVVLGWGVTQVMQKRLLAKLGSVGAPGGDGQ